MQVFKCRICGDPYIGGAKPSHCPFCGAPDQYIILAKDWDVEEHVALSDISKANLEHALTLETANSLFYACSFEVAMSVEMQAMFKALTKVEAEHASVIRKLLGLPKPTEEEDNRGRCNAIEAANIIEAHDRESRAISFYSKSADETAEPRVKEVFNALVEIETTHIQLVDDTMKRFGLQPNPVS